MSEVEEVSFVEVEETASAPIRTVPEEAAVAAAEEGAPTNLPPNRQAVPEQDYTVCPPDAATTGAESAPRATERGEIIRLQGGIALGHLGSSEEIVGQSGNVALAELEAEERGGSGDPGAGEPEQTAEPIRTELEEAPAPQAEPTDAGGANGGGGTEGGGGADHGGEDGDGPDEPEPGEEPESEEEPADELELLRQLGGIGEAMVGVDNDVPLTVRPGPPETERARVEQAMNTVKDAWVMMFGPEIRETEAYRLLDESLRDAFFTEGWDAGEGYSAPEDMTPDERANRRMPQLMDVFADMAREVEAMTTEWNEEDSPPAAWRASDTQWLEAHADSTGDAALSGEGLRNQTMRLQELYRRSLADDTDPARTELLAQRYEQVEARWFAEGDASQQEDAAADASQEEAAGTDGVALSAERARMLAEGGPANLLRPLDGSPEEEVLRVMEVIDEYLSWFDHRVPDFGSTPLGGAYRQALMERFREAGWDVTGQGAPTELNPSERSVPTPEEVEDTIEEKVGAHRLTWAWQHNGEFPESALPSDSQTVEDVMMFDAGYLRGETERLQDQFAQAVNRGASAEEMRDLATKLSVYEEAYLRKLEPPRQES